MKRTGALLRNFGPFLGGALAFVLTGDLAPRRAPRDFFDVASQLAVVLILAAAYQARLFGAVFAPVPAPGWRRSLDSRFGWATRILDAFGTAYVLFVIGAALLIGEIGSLSVIVTYRRSGDPSLVLASLVFAVVAIILSVLVESVPLGQAADPPAESPDEDDPDPPVAADIPA